MKPAPTWPPLWHAPPRKAIRGSIDRIYRMDRMGAGTGANYEWKAYPPVAGIARMGATT